MDLNILLGIHCHGSGNDSYGSKVWNIKSELGVEPYIYNLPYSHANYIQASAPTLPGSVTNPDGLKGPVPDGIFANIKGPSANTGGKIGSKNGSIKKRYCLDICKFSLR
jgi:hypothetical protein